MNNYTTPLNYYLFFKTIFPFLKRYFPPHLSAERDATYPAGESLRSRHLPLSRSEQRLRLNRIRRDAGGQLQTTDSPRTL